jgi:3-oxoadipate enol-lactonase
MQPIHANGIDIRYRARQRPAGHASHSLACNLEMWDREVAQLAKRFYRARLRPARPRHQRAARPYSLGMIADDVKAMFDALGIRKSHWIGLSMGGVFGLGHRAHTPASSSRWCSPTPRAASSPEGIDASATAWQR